MQRALKKNNLQNELATAIDGEAALEYLFAKEGDKYINPLPVLMLLDLKLPKVDGLEVLEQIRKHERTQVLPVVILTSSREQEDVISSYKLGVNSYVRKPVDFNQFVEAVQQLGLYWLVLNQNPYK
ncbi:MAG: two-component system response regulator [Anaerolineaceae bacterium]|nr:two-component system response regulator [Anaerolineaceae bacterium]